MKKQDCFSSELMRDTGVDVSQCYQCGKCTAGCVLASEMDYAPSYLMRLLQTAGEKHLDKVLRSDAIWICLNCENCVTRCPKAIDIPKVMDFLREKSCRMGVVNSKSKAVVAFHTSFLDSVKQTGRLYEVGLIAGFKARTFRFMQDLDVAPVMLAKGKLSLLPETVKDKRKVKRIFSQTIDNSKAKKK